MMQNRVRGTTLTRETLTTRFTNLPKLRLETYEAAELPYLKIPSRGAFVGQWTEDTVDPFPEILIVRDEDYDDTLAWLASYFNAIAPITQWCRILRQSQVATLATMPESAKLGIELGAWTGAILAECSVQALASVNLKELPVTAALSTATFAAARALAVWGRGLDLGFLADRYDQISFAVRRSERPLAAGKLLPVWHAVAEPSSHELGGLFDMLARRERHLGVEGIPAKVELAASILNLPQLFQISQGTQADRVRALDRLVEREGGSFPEAVFECVVGLGASLVDPGAAVLPDLLRKYTSTFPLAPIWLGVFAGIWSPARVLTENQGLGRLVSKALLTSPGMQERPSADIAFDELIRWIGHGGENSKIHLRGMNSRSLSVEIVPGVTSVLGLGSQDKPSQETGRYQRWIDAPRPVNKRDQDFDPSVLQDIMRRLGRLEALVMQGTAQGGLDFPEPDVENKKGRSGTRAKKLT